MKTKTWIRILCALCAVLIAVAGMGLLALTRLGTSLQSIAAELKQSSQNQPPVMENGELSALYEVLYSRLEQNGGLEKSEEQLKDLTQTILSRSLEDLQVESVTLEEDTLILVLNGRGVLMEDYDGTLLAKAAAKAALAYLKTDFLNAALSLFQSQQAVEKQLYGSYAPQLIETLCSEVDALPDEPFVLRVELQAQQDGWTFNSSQTRRTNQTPALQ